MSKKGGNKKTIKNNKKATKDKKLLHQSLIMVLKYLQGIYVKKIQESLELMI